MPVRSQFPNGSKLTYLQGKHVFFWLNNKGNINYPFLAFIPKLLLFVRGTTLGKRLWDIPIPEIQSTIGCYNKQAFARMEG